MRRLRSDRLVPEFENSKNRRVEDVTAKPSAGLRAEGKRHASVYDDLAGPTVLRRSGKAQTVNSLPGNAGETALSGRYKSKLDEQIGRQLRELYKNVLTAPVPEKFIELLRKLNPNGD